MLMSMKKILKLFCGIKMLPYLCTVLKKGHEELLKEIESKLSKNQRVKRKKETKIAMIKKVALFTLFAFCSLMTVRSGVVSGSFTVASELTLRTA